MANVKISELSPLITVQDADVLPIVDNAVTKKVTAAILRSYTEGNSVLLTGAQTVAGIKTFTAQLASSVATGTAPFSVASTTKVTNLNADLLDGLSSADFALSTRTLTAGTGLTGGGDLTANRTFAIDSTVATLTGTQTLTNKTITSPVINEILDSNGNELLGFTPIASATDYITIKNGIGVGVPLHISAAGSSTNTGLHLEPKGTGLVQISDGTDTTKGIRFRSSGSATSAVTLIDAVSSAGRVITLPNATGTVALTSDLTAYVPTTRTVSTTSPLAGGGNLGGDLTLSIPQSSGSVNGYLASTDFATFNAKQNAITLTTTGTSGAATLVGSTLNIPNYADTDTGITSLNGLTALTQTFAVGTSGTDFDISSATSTHTFNLPTASAANRGALSSADWTTFNNKQNALTNPITGTGTTNYLPKFTGASALGNSILQEGTNAIGLGITPSAWTDYNALQTAGGSLIGAGGELQLWQNAYYDGASKYYANGTATRYSMNGGQHRWFNAPSGTAGNAISFTQAMTLDASGQLGIGTSSPSEELEVYKSQNQITRILVNNPDTTNTNSRASLSAISGSVNGEMVAITGLGLYLGASSNNFLSLITNGSSRLDITAGGNVLIGTNTDSGYKLDVNGTARVSGIATFSSNVNVNGAPNDADIAMTIQASAGVGKFLLFGRDSSSSAVCNISSAGAATFSSVTTGADATINGVTVGKGAGNIANNTTIGFESLKSNTTGSNNTSVGYQTLEVNTTGINNTAIGLTALASNISGSKNTSVGKDCLVFNVSGSNNTGIGENALRSNTASNNTAVGFEAATSNTSGRLTAVGHQTGRSHTTGTGNALFGYQAGYSLSTGSNNTIIGDSAVYFAGFSGNCTIIGYNQQTGGYNQVGMIGISDTATGNAQMRFGSNTLDYGSVTTEVNASSKVWNVFINGVAQKILLA